MTVIRAAAASDAEAVASLLGELGYPIAAGQVAQRLEVFNRSVADHVLVTVVGEQVVGLASVSIAPLLVEGAFARLTALVVTERHRRTGLAKALVAEVERLAEAAGCTVIHVSTGQRPERDDAHRFYRHLGYTDAGTHHTLYEKHVGRQAAASATPSR